MKFMFSNAKFILLGFLLSLIFPASIISWSDTPADKISQLNYYYEDSNGTSLTTNEGIPIPKDENGLINSLKAGGPTLLEDFIFRERITHFDHERIPERVVHARGSGAHGFFTSAGNFSNITMAKLFSDENLKTPTFVRFSTVQGSRGSKDTPRDVRGFATKFYTDEGNWDLVGNNIPVFFIQDAIRFPDIIHAVKPEPNNEIPQASSAHDNFYDWISLMPESAHMLMWVWSDRALPRNFRMQDGFGVHTFRFINATGDSTFVKFHWRSVLGAHSTTFHEATVVGGLDPDFQRRDLWENIEKKDFPQYDLYGQLFTEEQAKKFDFDYLDPTKIISEEQVGLTKLGTLTLEKNPDNFFSETEQVAFCPANVVNGIDFTDDPLLQGRLFSYLDTQLTRLGGPNFQEIPINRPRCPWHNFQRDGYSRQQINKPRANYFPNSLNENSPLPKDAGRDGGFLTYPEKIDAVKARSRSKSFEDHFSQATMFYRSLSKTEQDHIVDAGIFELSMVTFPHIKEKMVNNMLANIDPDLSKRVSEGVNVSPPDCTGKQYYNKTSSKLSQFDGRNEIKTHTVAALVEEGFNGQDYTKMNDTLSNVGVELVAVGQKVGILESADGNVRVNVSKIFPAAHAALFDAVYVPGGVQSVDKLKQVGAVTAFINYAYFYFKPIAAASEGIELLKKGYLDDAPISKGNLTTGRGVVSRKDGFKDELGDEFVKALKQRRFWDRNVKNVPVS
ncbi:hypothetical protein HK098_005604 [Nowakowskiella sp. JEL0407]|nr:hypothetical protein HK098_005604 [Nowakowskiella sp. JEL0407]